MKMLSKIYLLFSLFFFQQTLFAQFDDVYYEPNTSGNNSTSYYENETTNTSPYNYDAVDTFYEESGDTYITNNYYNEYEDEEYYYSKNLRRYYTPTYAIDFYDF